MKRSATALGVVCVGVSAMITQIVFLREVLRLLSGNELVLGLFLCLWMFLTGTGSYIGGKIAFWIRKKPWMQSFGWIALGSFPLIFLIGFRALYHSYSMGLTVGLNTAFLTAFLILAPYCIVSGLMLTTMAGSFRALGCKKENATNQVYFLDSAGGVIGGILFSLFLVHFFSAVPALTLLFIVNIAVAFILALVSKQRVMAVALSLFTLVSLLFLGWIRPDRISSQWVYSGDLQYIRSTPYGELALTQRDGQFTVFRNGTPVGTSNDRIHAEWIVHPALAQIENPRNILILGGLLSGSVIEVAKYSVERIDCLEPDPVVMDWTSRLYDIGKDGRIHFIPDDYRAFLATVEHGYDVIVMDLPDPNSAQWNRFYTVEFFEHVHRALRPNGVFSFQLTGAANYASSELRQLQSSIYRSVSSVFPHILLLPGEQTGFLASRNPLDYNISTRLRARGIQTQFMTDAYLSADLSEDRLATVREIMKLQAPLNYDFFPAAYLIHLNYWLSTFGTSLVLPFLFILTIGVIIVLMLAGQKDRRELFVLSTTGFAGMGFEMITLVAFQVSFGSLYEHLGLVLAGFLFGATLGSIQKRDDSHFYGIRYLIQREIALILCGLLLLPVIFLMRETADKAMTPWFAVMVYSLVNGVLGYIAGSQFRSVATMMKEEPERGFGYLFAIDLFGACLGALLVSTVLLPSLGITKVCLIIVAIKCASLFWLTRNRSSIPQPGTESQTGITRWFGAIFATLVLSLTGVFIVLESSHGKIYDLTLSKVYHIFLLALLALGIMEAMGLRIPYEKIWPAKIWQRWQLFKVSLTRQTGVEPSRWLTYLVFSVAIFYPLFRCYFHVPYLLCHVCPRKCVFGWLRPYLIPAALVMNMEKRYWCYHVCPVGTLHHCENCATHTAKRRPGWFVMVPLLAMALTVWLYFIVVRNLEFPEAGGVNWFHLFFKNSFSFSGYVLGFLIITLLLGLRWWRPFCESLCPVGMFSELFLKLEKLLFKNGRLTPIGKVAHVGLDEDLEKQRSTLARK